MLGAIVDEDWNGDDMEVRESGITGSLRGGGGGGGGRGADPLSEIST